MRPALLLLVLLLILPARGMPALAAGQPVDAAIVLVSDVSLSITESEYALEKEGYASAIQSPEVVAAIRHGAIGAVALSYVEFAGPDQIATVIGWQVIRDQASAHRFTAALLAAPRSAEGRTAVGSGIAAAIQDLAESGFAATRRIIDVCGDGNSNTGVPLSVARAAALKAGITVNGLAIVHTNPPPWLVPHVAPPGGIVQYYHDNVIGGPGSFVVQVNTDQDFTAAMIHKLVLEIAARHRTGHGMGALGHEFPEDMAFNHRPLMAREAYSAEPGIYLYGVGGFRHDDTVVVGATPDVLTTAPKDLRSQTIL